MYTVYCDEKLLYHPLIEEYTILKAELDFEVNKAGSFTLSIPKENPHYGMMKLMKSIITVYDEDKLIFRGRPYTPNRNIYEDVSIICEGEMAFFNDSIQEPFDYTGNIEELFTRIIEKHNEQVEENKRFKVGIIETEKINTHQDIVRSSNEYQSTWSALKEHFFESDLGGYLYIRNEKDGNYVDYRADLNFIGNQSVIQGINLIDVEEEIATNELATVVIPLGAKIADEEGNSTEKYLTIESVNDGNPFIIDEKAVMEYGTIIKIVKHDNINDASTLMIEGKKDLASAIGVIRTVEITAADLSKAGYKNLNSFKCGSYVDVSIEKLNFNKKVLIKSMKLDLLNPSSNSITVGDISKTFTADSLDTAQSIGKIENNLESGLKDNQQQINQIIKETMSKIEQTEHNIKMEVSENYYPKNEADELIQSINTRFEQTANSFEFTFEGLRKEIEDISTGTNAEFEEWKKFIRFIDGSIHLGEMGNTITLTIENDRISFKNGGYEEAYLSNEGFFVRNGKFLDSISIGDFAFTVESDGSLSFGKVVS